MTNDRSTAVFLFTWKHACRSLWSGRSRCDSTCPGQWSRPAATYGVSASSLSMCPSCRSRMYRMRSIFTRGAHACAHTLSDMYVALPACMGVLRALCRWNAWNLAGCHINESFFRATVDAMAAGGYREAGYEYINLGASFVLFLHGCMQCSCNRMMQTV